MTTRCGPIEYQEVGTGVSLLVVHGSGGGHDQGMAWAGGLASNARQYPPVAEASALTPDVDAHSLAHVMLRALIPLGLRAVQDALQQEVTALAGPRYAHRNAHRDATPDVARWGSQAGSIFLADQKVPLHVPRVPRVRDRAAGNERPLTTYVQLQTPRTQDVGLFRRVLAGISSRECEAAAAAVPEAFGLTK